MNSNDEAVQERELLLSLANQVVSNRKRPMLVLFYPGDLGIDERQIELLHTVLTSNQLSREHPLQELDVFIHTVGGEPTAAYRLAQVIRDFTRELVFLVPRYAYSGGTLICLAGDAIMLGAYAVLSPIDITLHRSPVYGKRDEQFRFLDEEEEETEIQLVAIDHFIKVATQARIDIENEFRRRKWEMAKSDVENAMLCEMVRELGVIEIAKLYREKNITQEYARELLKSYMFKDQPLDEHDMNSILRRLVVEAPAHEFPMDYHICHDVGLKVEEMSDGLSDQCSYLLKQMETMVLNGSICDKIDEDSRLPFYQYFPYNEATEDGSQEGTASVSKESENGSTRMFSDEAVFGRPASGAKISD